MALDNILKIQFKVKISEKKGTFLLPMAKTSSNI